MEKEIVPVYELIESCMKNVQNAKRTARMLRQSSGGSFNKAGGSLKREIRNETKSEPENVRTEEQFVVKKPSASSSPSSSSSYISSKLGILKSKTSQKVKKQEQPQNQLTAESILKDFANQVARWRATDRRNPLPSDYASYLNQHFLCEKLDILPRSKMVTVARKAVAMEIDKINRLKPKTQPNEQRKDQKPTEKIPLKSSTIMQSKSTFDDLVARLETQQTQLAHAVVKDV